MARNYLEIFGRNIDAALDIGDPAVRLIDTVRGLRPPEDLFGLYRDPGHDVLGSHREVGRYHVSVLDDHDMVGRAKRRFAAGNAIPARYEQTAHAVGTQLTTLGIPCLYYGTEQAFDGSEDQADPGEHGHEDRYIREAMFGGTFGAMGTAGCHFFDPDHPTYLRVAAIARLRRAADHVGLALRRGRVYLRETSFLDRPYALPHAGELAAWSRILHHQEVLVALNSHGTENRGADVTIHASFHPADTTMKVLYKSDWSDAELQSPPQDQTVPVRHNGGRATVRIDLPPAGMAILAKTSTETPA
jgi:hypothetical protein